jgi:hypothetical protein
VNPLSALVRGAKEVARKESAFYSPLDKAISEITQKKGTGEQMLVELMKTKGVSKELKDRPAVKSALQQPKVTKEQLQKVAEENPPAQIFEKVEKGPSEARYRVEHDELNDRYDVVDDYSNVVKSFRDYDDAEFYAGKLEGGTTKYEDYQLPGGKNYREIKLMLPEKDTNRELFEKAKQDTMINLLREFENDSGLQRYQSIEIVQSARSGNPNSVNLLRQAMGTDKANSMLADARSAYEANEQNFKNVAAQRFKSSHYEEPNILAHARVSDRTGPNGEKILHVEEIQSDWHQKGRKKGYQLPPEERNALYKRRAEIESYGFNATPEQKQEWADVMNRLQPETQHKKVPDAPFKQNWHELVMKRLLDDAVKKGYDRVFITPGAEQAKRYDLSKHFGEISYKHNEDGTISIIGTDKKSGLANLHQEDIPKEDIAEYVGKEMADKIMNNVGTPYEGTSRMRQGSMTLSNLDLKVGGEGMEGFYDKMLPSFLNDYGKKWGANVKQYELSVPRKQPISSIQDAISQGLVSKDEVLAMDQTQRNALLDSFKNENIPVHSFDITPQMREDIVGRGQPLYQAIPAGVGAGTLATPQEEVPEQPMKRGGAVSMDAMRLAVINKQLRKHHG